MQQTSSERNALHVLSEAVSYADSHPRDKDHYPEDAFAKLEGPKLHAFIKSLKVILGGAHSSLADICLPSRHLADKHAMLFYNFEKDLFQIQCITRTGNIFVNNKPCGFHDSPCDLLPG